MGTICPTCSGTLENILAYQCDDCFKKRTGKYPHEVGAVSSKLAPALPTSRILDEFGFPVPTEPKAAISPEDLELTKRFLGNLKDQTLSRGIHKVLNDLLGRLP